MPVLTRESAPRTTPPSNSTATMVVPVWGASIAAPSPAHSALRRAPPAPGAVARPRGSTGAGPGRARSVPGRWRGRSGGRREGGGAPAVAHRRPRAVGVGRVRVLVRARAGGEGGRRAAGPCPLPLCTPALPRPALPPTPPCVPGRHHSRSTLPLLCPGNSLLGANLRVSSSQGL